MKSWGSPNLINLNLLEGNMNACTKLHGHPSNRRFTQHHRCQPHGGNRKSQRLHAHLYTAIIPNMTIF